MSFDILTVIVFLNVAVTIKLLSDVARRQQPNFKKKFIKRLLQSEPITPKHQPPKTIGDGFESLVSKEGRLFFHDFVDFAAVVNWWLADEYVGSRWRLQELPKTELTLHEVFDYGPTFGRSYAVFYNQVQIGELEVEPHQYSAERPRVLTRIHLDYARLLPFHTIRDFFDAIAMHTCYYGSQGKEYLAAQQEINRAMTEALWQSNQVDVYDIRAHDSGEINLQLDGIASWYFEQSERLRNKANVKP
jgi:hypothetical protein